jgi:hypothetical protein
MTKDINQIAFQIAAIATHERRRAPLKRRMHKPGRLGNAPGSPRTLTPEQLRELALEAFKDRLPTII